MQIRAFTAVLDCLSYFRQVQKSGDARFKLAGKTLRCRLSEVFAQERFHLAYDEDGTTCMYFADGLRWFGELPWTGVFTNPSRTILTLATSPISVPTELGLKTALPGMHICVDFPCNPCIFREILEAELGIASYRLVNGVITPNPTICRRIPVILQ
jgi:hypothetical protein